MNYITELCHVDFWTLIFSIVVILGSWKCVSTLVEWVVHKFGIETKYQRQRREDKILLDTTAELAKTTAENLANLQERHIKDEQEFRTNLNNYMQESKKDRRALHDEMINFTNNRIHDRAQSLSIQQSLTNSIEAIAKRQDDRDEKIKELTDLFVDKQISDYRWEIINLADKISSGKIVSKECYRHAISTHEKYEKIIKERNLTNGEVDISMEIIMESYRELLKDGELQ
jgi:hypothetical protein